MHIGKSYRLSDFLYWTRRSIYVLVILGAVPVLLYHLAGVKWLAVPWPVVSLLGTATAFIVGFKNVQTYNRTADGHTVWTNIANSSRAWGIICRDFLHDEEKIRTLIFRHFAWLTVLRYKMREERVWEVTDTQPNAEYQRYYAIPERQIRLEDELSKYLPEDELRYISGVHNKGVQLLAMQSRTIKEIYESQGIVPPQFIEMERTLSAFYAQQGQSESIKDTPYPRQYSTINTLLVRLFCFLLPFGMLHEFDELNNMVSGFMKGQMIWLVIPFSVIISWIYTSLDQVGESSGNPFEGSPNDVPISTICRAIEIDLREMLGHQEVPHPVKPQNDIVV